MYRLKGHPAHVHITVWDVTTQGNGHEKKGTCADSISFIKNMPKAELHVHLEGTLEPEMVFRFAERNCIPLKWKDPDDMRAAYHFKDLSGFLGIYFKGCEVMVTALDFYEATKEYLRRAVADTVRHTEFFLGPQSFLPRGIRLEEIVDGLTSAMDEMASQISSFYLPSVIRTRPENLLNFR